jgi:S1-C subfamily serine protease
MEVESIPPETSDHGRRDKNNWQELLPNAMRARIANLKFPSLVLPALLVVIGLISTAMSTALADELEIRIEQTVATVSPAVLEICPSGEESRQARGAGFFIDAAAGLIVTSFHVVRRSNEVMVRLVNADEWLPAQIVDFDADVDLALLRLQSSLIDQRVSSLQLKTDHAVRLGQFVIAYGSPGGLGHSVSLGIVSSLSRMLVGSRNHGPYIQIDAHLAAGSSGGPVTDVHGNLLGIVNLGSANGAAAFVLPVSRIVQFVRNSTERVAAGKLETGYAGFVLQRLDPNIRTFFGAPGETGVVVAGVWPNSAAADVGLEIGDILLSVGPLNLNLSDFGDVDILEAHIERLGVLPQEIRFLRDGKERKSIIKMRSEPPCSEIKQRRNEAILGLIEPGTCIAGLLQTGWLVLRDPKEVYPTLEQGDFVVGPVKNARREIGDSPQGNGGLNAGLYQIIRSGRPILVQVASAHVS